MRRLAILRPASAPLTAFTRSRRKPVQKTILPLSRYRLLLDEAVVWRLVGRGDLAPLPHVLRQWPDLRALSDVQMDAFVEAHPMPAARLADPVTLGLAVAIVLEVMRRHTGLALRQTQIACALSLLRGDCVEMRTGEGKTLAAGLAALVAARSGVSTHVITVNDYLAERDHGVMHPLAQRLGLKSAVLLQKMSDEDKRAAYDVDLLYGSNKTFVFDHLRDRREARLGKVPRQMGQAMAIVDEADSVLIDDATVPMILSEQSGPLPDADLRLFHALSVFAADLAPKVHRSLDGWGTWRLTPQGISLLVARAAGWDHPVARTDDIIRLAEDALSARYNFRLGEAYLVQDGKVVLVDQSTGRLMPDRRWSYGMHQFVEIKEGLDPTSENKTVAQITQQTYFRQYRILSGLTGTARECRGELWSVYRLPVQPIAPHIPPKLRDLGLRVFATRAEKETAIMDQAMAIAETRAVLIGVNDVIEAASLARGFHTLGREVAVLDAETEMQEAELVAKAGQIGRITIATHLAGRGTDIALQGELRGAGGLHVIIGSLMASARLERQLYGRAGRQGDPGSYSRMISLQDRGLTDGAQSLMRRVMTGALRLGLWAALPMLQGARDTLARKSRKFSLLREQDLSRQLGYR